MRHQRTLMGDALKGIVKAMHISIGLVVAALTLGICDLMLHLRPTGIRIGGLPVELPLAAIGFVLAVSGCLTLWHCTRQLAARLSDRLVSDLIVRDAERCGWYRRQRHAFGNHMQVVLGLLAFKRLDEAREYIKRVTGKLRREESARFDRSCPELDGLLGRKAEIAKERGTDVVVSRWDTCHRLGVSMIDACRAIGHALDLAIECAASCEQQSTVYVRNCTGSTLYTFLIEWRPVGLGSEDLMSLGSEDLMSLGGEDLMSLGGEDLVLDVAATQNGASSDAAMRPGLRVADVASLAEEAKLAGGAFTLGGDPQQGFVELSFPAIRAGDQE